MMMMTMMIMIIMWGGGFGFILGFSKCISGRNCFRFVPLHYLGYDILSSGPKPLSHRYRSGYFCFRRYSISDRETTSGRDSGSGLSVELRLSRTCDRRTMDLVVFSRLTSAERVTSTGVGTSSRGAETKSDSLTGRLRPTFCR